VEFQTLLYKKENHVGDGSRDISAEEIRENFAKISDLTYARPLDNNLETFQFMEPLLK